MRPSADPDLAPGTTGGPARRASWPGVPTTARLTLGLLAALLPLLGLGVWLALGQRGAYAVLVCSLVSSALALALVWWGTRPLARLAKRASALAGLEFERPRWLGLIERAPPWEVTVSLALDEIEHSLSEIQALSRIGQLIVSTEDLERMLRDIVGEAVAVLRANAGIIGLWDGEKKVFKDVAACNMPIAFPGRDFGVSESFTSHVAESGRVIFLDDYMSYPGRIKELEPFRFRATLGAPLVVKDVSKGALVVLTTSRERRFTARDGRLLATLADHAAAALEKARLYQTAVVQLEELSQAKEQLGKKSQELERALTTMVQVQEQERSRIAIDMHDGVVQSMVGSLYEMQGVIAHFPKAPKDLIAKQERARALLQEAIEEVRRVIFDLCPFTLDLAGLAPAVERLGESLQRAGRFRSVVRVVGTPYRFSREAETAAFRIVQEALSNVFKHSRATSARVTLRFLPERLELSVLDNGGGIHWEKAHDLQGERIGLIGMKQRALSVGGEFWITSAPAEGTSIVATIPRDPRGPVRPLQARYEEPAPVVPEGVAGLSGEGQG